MPGLVKLLLVMESLLLAAIMDPAVQSHLWSLHMSLKGAQPPEEPPSRGQDSCSPLLSPAGLFQHSKQDPIPCPQNHLAHAHFAFLFLAQGLPWGVATCVTEE